MGVVDVQHRIVFPACIGQFGQRRDIAVHTEHTVAHDQAAPVLCGFQQGAQCRNVCMRETNWLCPAQPATIEQ